MIDTEIYDEGIKTNPHLYDALEVNGVIETHDKHGTWHEPIFDDSIVPDFFSVYAHMVEGGVECIADFATKPEALAFAQSLAQPYVWPITVW